MHTQDDKSIKMPFVFERMAVTDVRFPFRNNIIIIIIICEKCDVRPNNNNCSGKITSETRFRLHFSRFVSKNHEPPGLYGSIVARKNIVLEYKYFCS